MNNKDYIKLARKCGLDDAIPMLYKDELIAFAKEVETQMLKELLARAGSWIDVDRTAKQMIAERRGE